MDYLNYYNNGFQKFIFFFFFIITIIKKYIYSFKFIILICIPIMIIDLIKI